MSDHIVLPQQTLQEVADVMAALQVEQIRAGLNSLGQPFPRGVDLIASGRLLASIHGEVRGGQPVVVSTVPYAEAVNARFGFLGICPAWLPELYKRLQPIVAKGATLAP